MFELKNIGITFNAGTPDENVALKNINLKINKGDFITVIGSNGAGKST
ncbi:MAG: ATP-binding cassette domain-containing protein, partial [Treponemataceae bacterium]|nr:ATP-binding cassette domain-containing protein [Treponemataceae bacterium]